MKAKSTASILIISVMLITGAGCSKVDSGSSNTQKVRVKKNQKATTRNQKKESKNVITTHEATIKIPDHSAKLGTAQKSDIWEFTVTKARESSSITDDLSHTKQAGAGKKFILAYLKLKNISDLPKSPLITYDPEPVIISGGSEYEYEDGLVYGIKTKDQFKEEKDLDPGETAGGWTLFRTPTGKHNFKFVIQDVSWDIGL